MNFNRDNVEFVKWCKSVGVASNGMQQEIWPKIFESLNRLAGAVASQAEKSDEGIGEVAAVDVATKDERVPNAPTMPDFEAMEITELKEYINEHGGTYHPANGKPKLIEIAKEL